MIVKYLIECSYCGAQWDRNSQCDDGYQETINLPVAEQYKFYTGQLAIWSKRGQKGRVSATVCLNCLGKNDPIIRAWVSELYLKIRKYRARNGVCLTPPEAKGDDHAE